MERNEVPEAMARAAAHWWADRADGTARHRTGENSGAAALAGLLADSLNTPPAAGSLERFEKILAEKIMTSPKDEWMSIWVDYAPEGILWDAAKEAGINPANFPWKTGMHIHPEEGTIYVRLSLGKWEKIYPE